ncbi:MAG: BTAD domain-containing putative transcriptional regulator [Nitrospirota bacterium]
MKQAASLAKLTRPKSANVLIRKRLFKLLDEARSYPVIWITAPPGAGKTTLISSYIETRKINNLWYQIDEGDGDIASFFHYMGIAAKQAAPRYRKSLPNLTPEYLQGLPTFTRNYFRELYSRVNPSVSPLTKGGIKRGVSKSGFAIVFDNYQDVPADSQLHEIIQTGLSEIPDGINVIIISRTDPPSAFAGLRANNRMNILSWNELKLSSEETSGIVQLKVLKKLSKEVIQELHAKTNGWAAGLVLMLEHQGSADLMQRHGDGFTTQAMFDYFAGEIFQKLDAASHEILLQTAFLPIMTGRFAQQLTGSHQAGEILAELSRRNYFTVKRPLPEPVYQYHPLFREFLLTQAKQQLTDAQLVQTQHRAGEILEGAGQFEDAIVLYRDAADWESMARLILTHAQTMITQGRNQMVEEWIKQMPESVVDETPWLLYYLGVCRLPFNPANARNDFEKVFELFQAQQDRQGMLISLSSIMNCAVYEGGSFFFLDKWIRAAETIPLESMTSLPADIKAQIVIGGILHAFLLRQPEHPDIGVWVERTLQSVESAADVNLRIQSGLILAVYFFWTGNFKKAAYVMNIFHEAEGAKGATALTQINILLTEAMYEWLVKADARSCLNKVMQGLSLSEATGVHLWDYHLSCHGLAAALCAGDFVSAEEMHWKMAAQSNIRKMDLGYYYILTGWYALMRGDVDEANNLLPSIVNFTQLLGMPFGEGLLGLITAQILYQSGKSQDAVKNLQRAHEIGAAMKSCLLQFMAWITEAQIAFDQHCEEEGKKALTDAFAIGKEQGIYNWYFYLPEVMSRLCVRALEYNIEVEYVQNLIRRRKLNPPIDEIEIENWPWPIRIYTLGRFAIVKDGKPLRFTEKAKHMPLKLLKAIISLGGRDISAEIVIDTLWPDADGDTGLRSLNTTLHRLRKLLGNDMAITLKDNRLTIDARYAWVDVFAFQRLMGKIENRLKKTEAKDDNLNHLMESITAMYQGPFLRDIAEQWALSSRERLKNRYLQILSEMANYFELSQNLQNSIRCHERCIEIDSISEENYRRLMMVYHKLGRKAEGLAVYKRCKEALRLHLDTSPSKETETIHISLRS